MRAKQSRDVRLIDSQITTDNNTFDTVKEFIYLGSAVTTKNDVRAWRSNEGLLLATGAWVIETSLVRQN